jgi:hypothetical protein
MKSFVAGVQPDVLRHCRHHRTDAPAFNGRQTRSTRHRSGSSLAHGVPADAAPLARARGVSVMLNFARVSVIGSSNVPYHIAARHWITLGSTADPDWLLLAPGPIPPLILLLAGVR